MDIQKELLDKIESFIKSANIAGSTFGLRAVNDGKFVSKLKNGSSITLKTYERVLIYMNTHTQATKGAVQPNDFFDLNPEAIIGNHTTITQQNHVEPGGKHAGK